MFYLVVFGFNPNFVFGSYLGGIFGDRLHAAVPEAAWGGAEVEAVLRARGVSLESVRPVRPSLEDLFLSLLKEGSP